MFIRELSGSAVKRLVMNAGAGQSVIHRVESTELDPSNMRGFQCEIAAVQLNGARLGQCVGSPRVLSYGSA